MVRKAGKHQTEANKQIKVLDPVHVLFYARSTHELHNRNASLG